MFSVAGIEPGRYWIGTDQIPQCGPKHQRRIHAKFWIDTSPISWAHYEVFVAGGGYRLVELWATEHCAFADNVRPPSVDQRHRELLDQARLQRATFASGDLRRSPLTGITWFEAVAIAKFYSARLPAEEEWEVAMSGKTVRATSPGVKDILRAESRWGCVISLGLVEEWTGSAFTSCYWRSEAEQPTPCWTPDRHRLGISVRGSMPQSLVQNISARRGQDPLTSHSLLSFRRVWEQEPAETNVKPVWR